MTSVTLRGGTVGGRGMLGHNVRVHTCVLH